MSDPTQCDTLRVFRAGVYRSLGVRRDALFEALDAATAVGPIPSLPYLSSVQRRLRSRNPPAGTRRAGWRTGGCASTGAQRSWLVRGPAAPPQRAGRSATAPRDEVRLPRRADLVGSHGAARGRLRTVRPRARAGPVIAGTLQAAPSPEQPCYNARAASGRGARPLPPR